MRKLERFAVRKPVLFGVLMIVAWSVLSALTYPLHFLFPDNDVGLRYGDGVSKGSHLCLDRAPAVAPWLAGSGGDREECFTARLACDQHFGC